MLLVKCAALAAALALGWLLFSAWRLRVRLQAPGRIWWTWWALRLVLLTQIAFFVAVALAAPRD